MSDTHARNTLLDDARQARHILQRHAVVQQLRTHLSHHAIGAPLPPNRVLAADLNSTGAAIVEAMRVLDITGEVAYFGQGLRRPYRLRPDEHHPDDTVLLRKLRQAVEERAADRHSPLPMQILANRHGVSPHQMERACQRLVAEQLITYTEYGWAGPGYYPRRHVRASDPPATDLNTPTTMCEESA